MERLKQKKPLRRQPGLLPCQENCLSSAGVATKSPAARDRAFGGAGSTILLIRQR
jgi:hypothetical protein